MSPNVSAGTVDAHFPGLLLEEQLEGTECIAFKIGRYPVHLKFTLKFRTRFLLKHYNIPAYVSLELIFDFSW